MNPPLIALFALRIAGPATLLLASVSLLFIKASSSPTEPTGITPVVVRVIIPRRRLIISLLSLAALTYFLDLLLVIVLAVVTRKWQGSQDTWRGIEIGDFLGLIAFATVAILGTVKESQGKAVWNRKRVQGFALLASAFDIAIVFLMITNIDFRKDGGGIKLPEKPADNRVSLPDFSHLVLAVLRLLFSIPLLTALSFPRRTYVPAHVSPTPIRVTPSSLLVPEQQTQYGTFTSTPAITNPPTPVNNGQSVLSNKPDPKQEIALDPTWAEMGQRLKKLAPYLWPKKSRPLQGLALLCIFLLVIGRFVNFALPLTFGRLVSIFEQYVPGQSPDYPPQSPWLVLSGYIVLRFLQSPGGLAALRDSLWAPVMQYSDREMSQLTFNHLLNLSLSFHTRRKTGEILRILDRGAAINHILELLLFNILPTIADMMVALAFFFVYFSWSLALVIFVVMIAYISASITLTTWRTKIRRHMNDQDVITRGIHTDCLLNYETVKYFGGEEHEGARYAQAIRSYQNYEYRVMLSLNLLNLIQTTIISLGLLAGSVIVANSVVENRRQPADFVIFITYLAQLYGPLNNLGYIYRSINQSLVDTERLMKLLDEPTDVNDKPDATELAVSEGEIEFDNVSFSYDGRSQALKGVTFKVPKGFKVALVGESGSGKSTVLRLLYRFYDLKPGEGRILIDGRDIRDVTQQSLRKAIGVVPQDSVLFNTSISYNIGYGKFDASHDEIENAAKLAQMHERILSFPDGYDTKVGERGVRLSGGEKQRVAIARTLLKNPPILLLDEATSALDTSTERDIQEALQHLVQGRSSLSIAHRLSTISSADLILVLKEGRIVEQGSHRDLLASDGAFAKMWADQVSGDKKAQSIISLGKEASSGYLIDDISPQPVDVTPIQEDHVEVPSEDHVLASDAILPTEPVVEDPVTATPDQISLAPEVEPVHENVPQQEIEGVTDKQSGEEELPAAAEPTYAAVAATDPAPGSAAINTEHAPVPASQPAVAFPVSTDDTSSHKTPSIGVGSPTTQTAGVTFSSAVDSPPRSGTPDPDSEPKRKRISSQNFQRLARRISLGPKRTNSGSSLGHDATPKDEESSIGSTAEASAPAESSKGKGKKDRKSKKKATR